MRRPLSILLVAIAVPVLLLGGSTARGAAHPWRMLVIVYGGIEGQVNDQVRTTMDALAPVCLPCRYIAEREDTSEALELDASTRDSIATQIEHIPAVINDWSAGRAGAEVDLVFSDEPITRDRMLPSAYGITVRADTVREQLEQLAPAGKYDSIFLLWRNSGALGSIVVEHAGLTWVTRDEATGAWISSLKLPADMVSTWSDVSLTHLFIHEWLHQVERVNMERGNQIARIHDPERFGYADQPEAWYRALLNGEIDERAGQFTILDPLSPPEPTAQP